MKEISTETPCRSVLPSKVSGQSNKTGTREWAEKNINIITGCKHNCTYCYARSEASRFNRCSPDDWKNEIIRDKDVRKNYRKRSFSLMYPSSHDIHPDNLEAHIFVLRKLLEAGNRVLIVSKPHLISIKRICEEFAGYKDNILFRFTIGSSSSKVLKFWEPGAPGFQERLQCLKYAFNKGFQTSVSCEPMLDNRVDKVIRKCRPYVTETIWIGKMNNLMSRLSLNKVNDLITLKRATELLDWQQNDENILTIYESFKMDPIIRWKDSIRKVILKKAS